MNYMEKLSRYMILHLDREIEVVIYTTEEGGFWAECSEFFGCIIEGETKEEIIENVKEMIKALTIPKNKI